MADMERLIRTGAVTGGPICAISPAHAEAAWMGTAANACYGRQNCGYDDCRQIGETEEIGLDRSGQMVGLMAEVGGFLDIGDEPVMVRVADHRFVPVHDATCSGVMRLSDEPQEELPDMDEHSFDRGAPSARRPGGSREAAFFPSFRHILAVPASVVIVSLAPEA